MKKLLQRALLADKHVCPWWLAFSFDNPLRRVVHNPQKIFNGIVQAGQKILDIGCGMGYFTLSLAKLVGENGQIIAADLQPEMLAVIQRRALRRGLQSRIRLHQTQSESIGLNEQFDFILAFWMVHEISDKRKFLESIRLMLKPDAHFLMAEPLIHVPAAQFGNEVEIAKNAGLRYLSAQDIRFSRAVLFTPQSDARP